MLLLTNAWGRHFYQFIGPRPKRAETFSPDFAAFSPLLHGRVTNVLRENSRYTLFVSMA